MNLTNQKLDAVPKPSWRESRVVVLRWRVRTRVGVECLPSGICRREIQFLTPRFEDFGTQRRATAPTPSLRSLRLMMLTKCELLVRSSPTPRARSYSTPFSICWSSARSYTPRSAASTLARELARLEESVVPGVRVKDLLTPYFVRERLSWPVNKSKLEDAAAPLSGVRVNSQTAWRSLFASLGYRIQELPMRGYLLRWRDAPRRGGSPAPERGDVQPI